MNVFILNSGRCGSSTFIQACQQITNFSAGHETRIHCTGEQRLAYPPQHIEADNRLCWLLGRLQQRFGDDAYYVHLHRDREQTAESFARRQEFGIMRAYREGILLGASPETSAHDLALDYLDTIESNIQLFLRDKTHTMEVSLENASEDFARFWEWLGAEGDRGAALAEWSTRHNASE